MKAKIFRELNLMLVQEKLTDDCPIGLFATREWRYAYILGNDLSKKFKNHGFGETILYNIHSFYTEMSMENVIAKVKEIFGEEIEIEEAEE